jgi:HAD superfamily hydrolase (TIGR01549 family)
MTTPVRGVLFDLDDTLFDHNFSTNCATAALLGSEPALAVWSLEELRRRHSELLETIHREVVAGRLSIDDARRERFRRLLADAGADEEALGRASAAASRYREEYQRSCRGVAGAAELLTALKNRKLRVAVVTNNLTAEQEQKIKRCGFGGRIDALITSEGTGIAKPEVAIFTAALAAIGVDASEAVMVGDAWDTDIAGALAAGVRPVWFNWRGHPPRETAVAEIAALTPLDAAVKAICS